MSERENAKRSFLERLFAVDHLAAAVWSVAIGVLAFAAGTAVRWYEGPDRVVVTNAPKATDTLVVRSVGSSQRDSALMAYLDRLSAELEVLRESDAVRSAVPSSSENQFEPNHLLSAPFPMPDSVEGYSPAAFGQFAQTTCPTEEAKRKELEIYSFRWLGTAPIADFTPVFVKVLQKNSALSYTEELELQFELRPGRNVLPIVVDLPEGKYEVTYGVFRQRDLRRKYPTLYSQSCELVISGK